MRKLAMVGVAALAAITLSCPAHADRGEPIIGPAGGAEQPLPAIPGDGIGPAGSDAGVLQPPQFERPTPPSSFQDYLDMISGKKTPPDTACLPLTWQKMLLPCDVP